MVARSLLTTLFCLASFQVLALECRDIVDIKLPKELTGKFTEISESSEGDLRIRIDRKKAIIDGNLSVRNEFQPNAGVSPYYQNGWLHDFERFRFKAAVAKRVFENAELSVFSHQLSETRGGDPLNWIKPDNYYELSFVVVDKKSSAVRLEQIRTFREEYLEYKKKGFEFLRSKPVDFRNRKFVLDLNCREL